MLRNGMSVRHGGVLLAAGVVACALGVTAEANAGGIHSRTDAQLRATAATSLRERGSLDSRARELRGGARHDVASDASVGVELAQTADAAAESENGETPKTEMAAGGEAEFELVIDAAVASEIERSIGAGVTAEIAQSVAAEVDAAVAAEVARAVAAAVQAEIESAVQTELESAVMATIGGR